MRISFIPPFLIGMVVVMTDITSTEVVLYVQINDSEVIVVQDLKFTIPFWISIAFWR